MNFQHQLPVIPENTVVATWRQPLAVSQSTRQACFVTRLNAELATSHVDIRNLQDMCKQANFECGWWRQEYDELLSAYRKVSNQNSLLLGQNWRLKEQLRASKARRVGLDARRDNGDAYEPESTRNDAADVTNEGSTESKAVDVSGVENVDRISEEDDVKEEANSFSA
ncbi:Fc.00g056350.m01.CDS01 [Cosmosporella sp. VM-42]